ncbi:MAG: DUF2851 family protein [Dehalococcoidia bacterium]
MTAVRAAADDRLLEHELTAAWLMGRVPAEALPWPLLRPGRAGRGPGPDVREAAFVLPSGVVRSGDVEVHLRASDFLAHGHGGDPAYANVIVHLVWDGTGAGEVEALLPGLQTVVLGTALGQSAERLRRLVRAGPSGGEPCASMVDEVGAETLRARVRLEGRRRLAERTWRAADLAARLGWDGAWAALVERALRASAGRRAESDDQRAELMRRLDEALGDEPLRALAGLAGDRTELVAALRAGGAIGAARAAEVGWNAALPLLAAYAAAYQDVELAGRTARLAAGWPAPRPYGRTRALEGSIDPAGSARRGGGALWAQGLLHLQDLWCTRGGCGACPLSSGSMEQRGGLASGGVAARSGA